MRSGWLLVLVLVLAGCGAQLEENLASDARTDAPLIDAAIDAPPVPPDAPPVDARQCEGGDGAAMDSSTGSCFVYFTGPSTYPEAEAACTAFGSTLAVIKSAQTNAVVRSLIGQTDAFVGATDRMIEDTYLWLDDPLDPVDGLGAGYTNWREGEPNDGSTNGEDCMIIEGDQDGTWDDRPCEPPPPGAGAYAYICQF